MDDSPLTILSFLVLIFSVVLHETMHAVAAVRFGDKTSKHAGRISLNPLPHVDLIGTVLLPIFLLLAHSPILVAWAKPVPINPLNFTQLKRAVLLVSAAGIITNFVIALLGSLLYHILLPIIHQGLLTDLILFTIEVNLVLAIINLIPTPPLDGAKMLLSYLPHSLSGIYKKWGKYGIFILIFLMFIPFKNSTFFAYFIHVMVEGFKNLMNLP